jgi:hypothetical protein
MYLVYVQIFVNKYVLDTTLQAILSTFKFLAMINFYLTKDNSIENPLI